MDNQLEAVLTIILMSVIVYLTRAGGYFMGIQIRHIGQIRPILEALPGCAMMAIIVPAVLRGSIVEFISLILVVVLMWKTGSVVIATLIGIGCLVLAPIFIHGVN